MAIVIYTYSNPYRLHREPYWAAIKNGFHLTASQTLASGLCDQYKNEFFEGKLTTITRFMRAKPAPPKDHPCHGCKRYGESCVLPCYRGVEVIPPISDPDRARSR